MWHFAGGERDPAWEALGLREKPSRRLWALQSLPGAPKDFESQLRSWDQPLGLRLEGHGAGTFLAACRKGLLVGRNYGALGKALLWGGEDLKHRLGFSVQH